MMRPLLRVGTLQQSDRDIGLRWPWRLWSAKKLALIELELTDDREGVWSFMTD